MKAWQVNAWGEPESMTFADSAVPEPGPRQVRIRNRAAGLNFFDILQIQGSYQYKPPFPFTPGAEVAGIVDKVGAEVTSLKPGDEVLSMTRGGAFAECTLGEAHATFPIPPGMSFEAAAAMPIVYQTSYFALTHRVKLQPDQWLLVHAGASGVGMSAIQIGKALGAKVIATAGSGAKIEFAREQGADFGLIYNDPSWVEQVKLITNAHGADVIYDPVGGEVFDLSTKCIAPEGSLLVIGFASGRIPSIAANRILLKNMSVVGVVWGGYIQQHPEYYAIAHEGLTRLHETGQIRPAVGRTYPLEQCPQALRALANREILGKAVLVMNP
jgi:NADPH2:quinone reductase